jgi:hypothetical protein
MPSAAVCGLNADATPRDVIPRDATAAARRHPGHPRDLTLAYKALPAILQNKPTFIFAM